MNKYYTGIGSRNTPKDIQDVMRALAHRLEQMGYTLRSGGANGADLAFEEGVTDPRHKEIYLPWKSFNNSISDLTVQLDGAYELASRHHPAWNSLKDSVKKLMARNSHQVLGHFLNNPSKFVVCWTPDGCLGRATRTNKTGGTGLAIAVADEQGIEIINLAYKEHLDRVLALIGKE